MCQLTGTLSAVAGGGTLSGFMRIFTLAPAAVIFDMSIRCDWRRIPAPSMTASRSAAVRYIVESGVPMRMSAPRACMLRPYISPRSMGLGSISIRAYAASIPIPGVCIATESTVSVRGNVRRACLTLNCMSLPLLICLRAIFRARSCTGGTYISANRSTTRPISPAMHHSTPRAILAPVLLRFFAFSPGEGVGGGVLSL